MSLEVAIDWVLIGLFGLTVALVCRTAVAVLRPQWLGRPAPEQMRAQPQAARVHLQKTADSLSILAAIAQAAPFIGLIGTCLHIVSAIAAVGPHGVLAVTENIAKALYTTVWGLASAVPAAAAFALLTPRLQRQTETLEVES